MEYTHMIGGFHVSYLPALTGLAVFILEIMLAVKGIIFAGGRKKLEKAKQEGRVIAADRTYWHRSRHYGENGKGSHWECYAEYEYDVGKKRKKKKVYFRNLGIPPLHLELYYITSPDKRVYTEEEMDREPFIFLFYLIPLAAGVCVEMLLRYLA